MPKYHLPFHTDSTTGQIRVCISKTSKQTSPDPAFSQRALVSCLAACLLRLPCHFITRFAGQCVGSIKWGLFYIYRRLVFCLPACRAIFCMLLYTSSGIFGTRENGIIIAVVFSVYMYSESGLLFTRGGVFACHNNVYSLSLCLFARTIKLWVVCVFFMGGCPLREEATQNMAHVVMAAL